MGKCLLGFDHRIDVCQMCLLEVVYKNDVTIQGIQLCVEDCPFVGGDGQSRGFPGGTVFEIKHSRCAMGRKVEESDSGFRRRIEIINPIVHHRPIAPVACFQRAYDRDLFAAIRRLAP